MELKELVEDTGYSRFDTYLTIKSLNLKVPYAYFALCEHFFGVFPKRYVRKIAKVFIPTIFAVAVK